jgi:divalent metal cation (Fe/Co/Zn/Cd) transporter
MPPRPDQLRSRTSPQYLTVGWNIAEASSRCGVAAGSIALIGFGVDSFVETISGRSVWRLRAEAGGDADEARIERVERRAARLVAVSFLVLAAYVAFEAVQTLVAQERPAASPVGIALTSISIAVMLWLARAKRATGEALGSRALVADSHQTYACWYLSVTTLAGLALNAVLGLWWADPSPPS